MVKRVCVIAHQDDNGLYYWIRDRFPYRYPYDEATGVVKIFRTHHDRAIDIGERFLNENRGKTLKPLATREIADCIIAKNTNN